MRSSQASGHDLGKIIVNVLRRVFSTDMLETYGSRCRHLTTFQKMPPHSSQYVLVFAMIDLAHLQANASHPLEPAKPHKVWNLAVAASNAILRHSHKCQVGFFPGLSSCIQKLGDCLLCRPPPPTCCTVAASIVGLASAGTDIAVSTIASRHQPNCR